MNKVTLISVDLAKDVFQVAGFTDRLKEVFNRQVKRRDLTRFLVQQPTCEVVMEACYSSHYWGRVFRDMGHRVRLLPAQHVKPFVRGNKSDHNDAVAIAEASRRPKINEVPIKTVAQQEIQSLHRMRDLCVQRRTAVMNQARGLLSEYDSVECEHKDPIPSDSRGISSAHSAYNRYQRTASSDRSRATGMSVVKQYTGHRSDQRHGDIQCDRWRQSI